MRGLLPAPAGTAEMFSAESASARMAGRRRRHHRAARRFTARTCSASDLELWLLAGLFLFYALILAMGEAYAAIGVVAGGAAYTAALGLGAYRCAFAGPAGIWSPLFWFRTAAIVFLGLGTLAFYLVNDFTRLVIDSFYPTSDAELLKASMIVTLGTIAILATTRSIDRRMPPVAAGRDARPESAGLLLRVGLAAALVGAIVRYGVVLPYYFGYGDVTPPGVVLKLGVLMPVAFYMLGSWCVMRRPRLLPLVFAVAGIDCLFGLLAFNKTDLLLTLAMTSLGLVHLKVSRVKLALIALACLAVYGMAVPVVNYGRTVQMERYGSIAGATLGERAMIVRDYFGSSGEAFAATQRYAEFQNGWSRISYANQMGFAVAEHDAGRHGDSISHLATAIVPRILWPDKPNMNYLTAGFNEAATGSPASFSWPGQFVEAYWNFGWIGVVACMIPLGIVYAIMSRYAIAVVSDGRWIEFPLVLMMMRWATDIMSPYATNVGGGLLTLLAFYLLLKGLTWILAPGAPAQSLPKGPKPEDVPAFPEPVPVTGGARIVGRIACRNGRQVE